ncbi:2-C-methyl-D-erythritol 2,4-cyclodiphosphate synthase [Candidatus Caldatribacterium saccharofermentans]|uniref:2-C-methyl-D-erythritol 2,4-cyclodiphosphate synthase n=1 Tax=Candidatus Caldatribacterium saccharofermentans TaxID=1454753 RepID=UPI003CFC6D5D
MVPYRVGLGYDIHPLVEGRRLVLGGVLIPFERGLLGHSDGDVVCHALMDSLLGACGLGDIGEFFPPQDPKWLNAESIRLLEDVVARVREKGWDIGNVDVMLVAEKPRIAPFVARIRENLARILGVPKERIGFKVTTNEGLGSIGRGEGMCCFAVSLLVQGKP